MIPITRHSLIGRAPVLALSNGISYMVVQRGGMNRENLCWVRYWFVIGIQDQGLCDVEWQNSSSRRENLLLAKALHSCRMWHSEYGLKSQPSYLDFSTK